MYYIEKRVHCRALGCSADGLLVDRSKRWDARGLQRTRKPTRSNRPAPGSRRLIEEEAGVVRLKLATGTNLVILASADEVNRALRSALDSNESMKVRTPDGVLALDPRQVVYVEEEPEGPSPPPLAVATLEVNL